MKKLMLALSATFLALSAQAHCCDPCGCAPPPPPPPPPCCCECDAPVRGARSEFHATVNFAPGSAALDDKALVTLASAKKAYSMFADEVELVALTGHTDDVGSEASNIELSVKRVFAVRAHLSSLGMDVRKIRVTWFGESSPIASNKTRAGRAANRRVTVDIK